MKPSIRGSDVFIKEDVRSVLQALLATNETLAGMPGMDRDAGIQQYRQGFAAAIAATAAAFDIKLQRPDVIERW
ncbi:MAG: hypothetical protein KIT77_24090 [Caldilinea sp.]|nr:hypothetical protein [Caldilinea sp.]